ncbi:MAG TPA: hypothetical protein VFE19_08675 [Jatrophihabitantaceae bacterium]|jgi:hypothetical protein|nr:hypothetical protein [Jatrophihabitantaceae bacterium]
MTYAPPPVPASAGTGKPRLRGRIPLRLAIIFLVLGVAGIAVGAVIAYNGALKKVNDFQRITIPQNGPASKKINFGGTGGFIAYYESKNATASRIPNVPVVIVSPSHKTQQLKTPYGGTAGGKKVKSLTYDFNGHKGVALWQFSVTEKGTYNVFVGSSSIADPDGKIAFGRSIGKSTAIGAVLIAVGALLLVVGIILLIIGLVKRSRNKKELAAAGAGTPYGGFGAPMYGQPGQPQQPGQAPQPQYGQQPAYGTPPPPPPPQQQNPWPPQNDS